MSFMQRIKKSGMKNNRREFIKNGASAGIGLAGLSLFENSLFAQSEEDPVKHKQESKGELRIGFIGTGSRGRSHIHDTLAIDGIQVAAICDIRQSSIDQAMKQISDAGRKAPKVYTGDEYSFKKMLLNEKPDAVIIATPWEWHVHMTVASMKSGTGYTAVEVSAANTLEECWDLVNVHEETGKQLMILENVCYRRDVMAILNMVRLNLFGELIHCRCGYGGCGAN
jgi:predicted dehydrogenase